MASPKHLTISRDNVVSQVAAFLYATKQVPDRVEILDIHFDKTAGDLWEMRVDLKADGAEVFDLDGT